MTTDMLASNIAGATAATLWAALPSITKLPCSEAFERLELYVLDALRVYRELRAKHPEPSVN